MKKIYDLEMELKKIIEGAVKDFQLNTAEGSSRTPEIIIGPIPSENPEELVPAIGIVASAGRNTLESKEISIETDIVLAIEDTEKTYRMLYDMIDIILSEIIRVGIYFDEFEVLPDADWKVDSTGILMAANIMFKFIRIKTYRTDADDWIYGR